MKNQFPTSFKDQSLQYAQTLDALDNLAPYRKEFVFPDTPQEPIYFTGHSLGLMPKKAKTYIEAEIDKWGRYAVEGHFQGQFPWLPYHEFLTPLLAQVVGAEETEVVAMNSLTVNLHLMMISFYRPKGKKNKILIENNTFPSDRYAVESQIRLHGLDPREVLVELKPKPGQWVIEDSSIQEQIFALKDTLALVMLGNCNYLSGQRFDFAKVADAAHAVDAYCGFNLAHGAGNLHLTLHDWNVDFAVWCSYKYLNSGPGGIAGAFVHKRHHQHADWPRLAGWWGHDKKSRFKMGPEFIPIPTVESWQLSNPPIFQLASHRAALEIFADAKMNVIVAKSLALTNYFEFLLKAECADKIDIITPPEKRGSMLCLKFKQSTQPLKSLHEMSVFVDFREPNIIRATPAPLYNSFTDVYHFVERLKGVLNE